MKKEYIQTIKIPEGVEVEIRDHNKITVKGPQGESSKEFKVNNLTFEKKGDEIVIGNKKATKNEKKMINTIRAHVKNMLAGILEKFEYKLKVCYNHFPFTVEIKGKEAVIKNFLGEKVPRKVMIPDGVEVKIEKEIITITSNDKEIAGQAAANLETATKIRLRDRRIFQDGIFITSKGGKEI
ncbi:MAG: 50S ribosomal protein L6 [Candidatus Pacearchaeota archaeon]